MQKKFKKSITLLALSLLSGAAISAPIGIDSYDITNSRISGYGGWQHTYNGTISSNGDGTYDYSNGSGTLNDAIYGTDYTNTQLFSTPDQSAITLHLDAMASVSSLTLFSFYGGNSIPGNITGMNVSINGVTQYISTVGTGPAAYSHSNTNELISLVGTLLEGMTTNTITLSGFTTESPSSNYFSISEIDIDGAYGSVSVPEPATLPLFGLAALMLGFARRKQA